MDVFMYLKIASTVSLVSCSIGFGYTPVKKISTTITDNDSSTFTETGSPDCVSALLLP